MVINKDVNIPKLYEEIVVVYPELEYINRAGNEYTFVGISDESVLTQIVSDHDSVEVYFRLDGTTDDPTEINYDIRGYHKEKIFQYGELREVNYYENFNGGSFSNIVVKEQRSYTRDPIHNLAQYRTATHSWYYNNDEIGAEKVTVKYYDSQSSLEEAYQRRQNVINQTKTYTLGALGRTYSFDFLTSVKDEMDLFKEGYIEPLPIAVQNSTKVYLTQQIKDDIVENLRLS